jgi:hypothetical protein
MSSTDLRHANLIRQGIVSIELQIKDHPSSAEVVFYLFRD